MSPATPTFAPDPPSPARVLVERQLGVLTRLADIGMEIAEAAGRRAVAALDGDAEVGDPSSATLAYDRAARAVRMTIALQARLLEDLPGLEKAEDRLRSEKTNDQVNRAHRIVERAVEAERGRAMDWRRSGALRERLRDRDDYGAVLKLPLGEAVALICRDLGLSPDWSALVVEGLDEPPDAVRDGEAPPPTPLGGGGGGAERRRGLWGATAGGDAPKPPSRPSAVLPPLPSGIGGRAEALGLRP